MNNRRVIMAACIALAAMPLFAAALEELVEEEQAAALRAGQGPVIEVQLKNPIPALLPRHAELRRLAAETIAGLEPNLFVETLSLYKKPEGAAQWSDAERTGLFNQLIALSTLAGIQYYSASRKTMRTFYETSQVIDNPESKKLLPDPAYAVPPAALTLYARQKDLTFGDNIYRYDYQTNTDSFFFVQQNLTVMNAGIIPAVGKNKFRTVLALIDTGDSILIYAAAMAKAASLPGLGERIGNSFTNRMAAILTWFGGRADTVFGR